MLSRSCTIQKRLFYQRAVCFCRKVSSTTITHSQGPNAPLDLDPSLHELLKDVDMSLSSFRAQNKSAVGPSSNIPRELEIMEFDQNLEENTEDVDPLDEAMKERKSPRASFGSRSIGSVFLPDELRDSIETVIQDHDKPRLHEDAKRLFLDEKDAGMNLWDTTYSPTYKSRKQADRHADRDGTAFASVALPAHYSVIYAVLESLKHRLGDEWAVRHILEWGSGVGSGLWASMHAFQEPFRHKDKKFEYEPNLSQSSISSYLGIDKRDGLSTMAKRLVENINVGTTRVRWQRGFSETEQIYRPEGTDALALSAFYLSSLPTPLARRDLVKQIWSSGASVIVLIDHDSPAGFENIAEARDYLLRMGRKEFDDPSVEHDDLRGCHVVAPCPHDGACPLRHGPSRLVCSFSQRLQRPSFLRKTKHVKAGHEDVGYTYVVIKRGKRPDVRSLEEIPLSTPASDPVSENMSADINFKDRIRTEAYSWPRLVFPPLKKSGHVILDGCTREGQIMRMTIPRSQGKQAYYDARKSSWGDIFPHEPKNPPQVKFQSLGKDTSNVTELPGSDIGKRKDKGRRKQTVSYDSIAADLKESKKQRRREHARKTEEFEELI